MAPAGSAPGIDGPALRVSSGGHAVVPCATGAARAASAQHSLAGSHLRGRCGHDGGGSAGLVGRTAHGRRGRQLAAHRVRRRIRILRRARALVVVPPDDRPTLTGCCCRSFSAALSCWEKNSRSPSSNLVPRRCGHCAPTLSALSSTSPPLPTWLTTPAFPVRSAR